MERRCSYRLGCGLVNTVADAEALKLARQTIKCQINHRRGVKGQELAEQQSADDRDAERVAKLGSRAASEGEGQSAEKCRHRGHHDGTKTQQAGLVDCVL